MIWLYVAALIAGVGTLALQAILGHDTDVDGDGIPDHDTGDGPLLVSMRFWTFLALSFGISGALMTLFRLAPPMVVLAIAGAAGVAAGVFAALVIRGLKRGQVSSSATADEAVGRIAEVLVPCERGRVGKVRLELRGQTFDLLATSRDPLAIGTRVIVDEVEGGIARVVRAPEEISG